MAIPNLICIKSKGAGMVQVYELSGGDTLTQLGNDVTSDFEAPSTGINRPSNRSIVFNGMEMIFHRNTIRERDSGGANTWGVVETFSDMAGTGGFGFHSGLYEITIDGTAALAGIYQNTHHIHPLCIGSMQFFIMLIYQQLRMAL